MKRGTLAFEARRARRDRVDAPLRMRLRVLLRRGTLDSLLAGGWDPAIDPRLALRARQLARPALRARLASQLRDAVLSLTDIAPRVRGVAIVNRLITDGLSPLYMPGAADRLRMTLLEAGAAL